MGSAGIALGVTYSTFPPLTSTAKGPSACPGTRPADPARSLAVTGCDDRGVATSACPSTGALLKLSTYLHDRTRGMNRQPVPLVREAALDAILDEERIPQASQERVDLDEARSNRSFRRTPASGPDCETDLVITPGPAPCTTPVPGETASGPLPAACH